MLNPSIVNAMYILAAIFFVFGLKMLSNQEKARKGNFISAIGMLIAIIAALLSSGVLQWYWIATGMILGAIVGAVASRVVAMTAMPEMVALFNGFGGAASMLVGWVEYQKMVSEGTLETASIFSLVIIVVTVLIGGVTFTGSIVAWGKLAGKIPSKPIKYPGQQIVNFAILIILAAGLVFFAPLNTVPMIGSYNIFIVILALSCILGITFVIPIGGGDMPVVISLLNSLSGMAACAAGFVISNNVLIVAGALVGSSGIILTTIMCKAMNRSLSNVLFSGFGSGGGSSKGSGVTGEANPISIEDTYLILEAASSVLIVPGYGMAVAQAQHAVQELAAMLEENGTEVNFAIHPVAGRMPGHMNVLLCEVDIPYDKLYEMDNINNDFAKTDLAIIIGASDVVNPAANTAEGTPIYGMPVLSVENAKRIIICNFDLQPGYAGVPNPLYEESPDRMMLLGDAKDSINKIIAKLVSKDE